MCQGHSVNKAQRVEEEQAVPSLHKLSLAVFTQHDKMGSVESSLVGPLSKSSPQTLESDPWAKLVSHSMAGRSLTLQ